MTFEYPRLRALRSRVVNSLSAKPIPRYFGSTPTEPWKTASGKLERRKTTNGQLVIHGRTQSTNAQSAGLVDRSVIAGRIVLPADEQRCQCQMDAASTSRVSFWPRLLNHLESLRASQLPPSLNMALNYCPLGDGCSSSLAQASEAFPAQVCTRRLRGRCCNPSKLRHSAVSIAAQNGFQWLSLHFCLYESLGVRLFAALRPLPA